MSEVQGQQAGQGTAKAEAPAIQSPFKTLEDATKSWSELKSLSDRKASEWSKAEEGYKAKIAEYETKSQQPAAPAFNHKDLFKTLDSALGSGQELKPEVAAFLTELGTDLDTIKGFREYTVAKRIEPLKAFIQGDPNEAVKAAEKAMSPEKVTAFQTLLGAQEWKLAAQMINDAAASERAKGGPVQTGKSPAGNGVGFATVAELQAAMRDKRSRGDMEYIQSMEARFQATSPEVIAAYRKEINQG